MDEQNAPKGAREGLGERGLGFFGVPAGNDQSRLKQALKENKE